MPVPEPPPPQLLLLLLYHSPLLLSLPWATQEVFLSCPRLLAAWE
jgi:hypothetical protein